MSQAEEPSYAELKRLYAELVLECAAAKDQNVAYRLKIQDKANENMTYTDEQLKQALAKMLPEQIRTIMEYMLNKPIWKSYVWHEGKCYFVSTIERTFDTYEGSMRGQETIVWAYDWDKSERGEMLHQAGNICDHKQICHCIIAEGMMPDENNERTKRFCR